MMAAEPQANRQQSVYSKASRVASTSDGPPIDPSSQMFTIGKIDAGIAVLISDSVHLIEFPSLLLPPGVGPGSIVNISCTRNLPAERHANDSFWSLQSDIFSLYGSAEPKAPVLKVRNVTQTSVTLEWDKLELASAKLLGLAIWRNGQRLTNIPNPSTNTSTKLSGLSLDTDYTFHLVMKTSAGTFQSPLVKLRTHTIEDTSGVSVCFGHIQPEGLKQEAEKALREMKGKGSEKIQIDTTHFVATSPANPNNPQGGPGAEYQKALQLSIPVVSPEWVIACAREKKLVAIANYYSVGSINHAASLSSAQLVTSTGAPGPLPRRVTAVTTVGGAGSPTQVPEPFSPPLPGHAELAEEEPEGPPEDQVGVRSEEPAAPVKIEEPVPQVATGPVAVPEIESKPEAEVEEVEEIEPEAPEQPPVEEVEEAETPSGGVESEATKLDKQAEDETLQAVEKLSLDEPASAEPEDGGLPTITTTASTTEEEDDGDEEEKKELGHPADESLQDVAL